MVLSWCLFCVLLLTFCRRQALGGRPVETFSEVAHLADNVGDIVYSARSYRNSRDPLHYVPFEVTPENDEMSGPPNIASLASKIAACDPKVHGVCCLLPTYCAPKALCSSSRPTLSIGSWIGAAPKCTCPAGYIGDGRTKGTGCQNVNECVTKEALCQHICQDLDPGYACNCHPGYRLGRDRVSCVDINECEERSHRCSHQCVNLEGSYACRCPIGHELDNDGATCLEVNECPLMLEIANYLAQQGQEDAPEKSSLSSRAQAAFDTLQICEYPELCDDVPHGYYCRCPLGFHVDPKNPTRCVDTDECTFGAFQQDAGDYAEPSVLKRGAVCASRSGEPRSQECTNVYGSFLCSCAKGFRPFGRTLPAQQYRVEKEQKAQGPVAMDVAYLDWVKQMNTLECIDINECQNDDPCSAVPSWSQSVGAVSSETGRELPADVHLSAASPKVRSEGDIPSQDTGVNATWNTRQLGAPPNDEGRGDAPAPITVPWQDGGFRATCVNTIGSYECRCPKGYEYNSELRACSDQNECLQPDAHLCDESLGEECVNVPGGYKCRCKTGYRTVPRTSQANYRRLSAPPPFWEGQSQCIDVDECAEGIDGCTYQCRNTIGSYECDCPPGYEVAHDDHRQCVDIDECQLSVCPDHTPCINLPGTYICGCPPGYAGAAANPRFLVDATASSSPREQDFASKLSKSSRKFIYALEAYVNSPGNKRAFIQWTIPEWTEPLEKLRQDITGHTECVDINECSLMGNVLCPRGSTCVNQEASFYCACPSGYRPRDTAGYSALRPPDHQLRVDLGSTTGISPRSSNAGMLSDVAQSLLGRPLGARALRDREQRIGYSAEPSTWRPDFGDQRPGDISHFTPWRRQLGLPTNAVQPGSLQFRSLPSSRVVHLLTAADWSRGVRLGIIAEGNFRRPPWLLLHLPLASSEETMRQLQCEDIDECREAAQSSRDLRPRWCSVQRPCCVNLPGSYECYKKTRTGFWWVCPAFSREGIPTVDLTL